MFTDNVSKTNRKRLEKLKNDNADWQETKRNNAMRFLDMQNVLAGSLAGPQQAVNNAENYPSTWTTNPDGGANGQVQ